MYEQRDNSGTMFKNNKPQSEKSPHYRGDCKINGVDMWVSMWMKTSQKGNKFWSLSFQPKQKRDEFDQTPQDTGDDLPW